MMSPTLPRRLLAIHRVCGLIFSLNMLVFSVTGILLCLPLIGMGRHVLRRS